MRVLLGLAVSLVHAEIDCMIVLEGFYPGAQPCASEMFCSGDFACTIKDYDDCMYYMCNRELGCPPGTTYLPFYPSNAEAPGLQSSESIGHACYPNELIPAESFECSFETSYTTF